MKRIVSIVLLAAVSCMLFSCAYSAYKEYYYQEDYQSIWELSGVQFASQRDTAPPLFPETIDELQVKDFLCRYDQQLPLGEGIQVCITIEYQDGEAFNAEIERIAMLAFDGEDSFGDSGVTAYVYNLGAGFYYEYALVDEDTHEIKYIYIESLPEDELEIDKKYLPDNYKDYGYDVPEETDIEI